MKLFSRLAFICNVSFVIFILLGYIELSNKTEKGGDNVFPLPFLTGTLVILGQLAIFLNFIFCLISLHLLVTKRLQQAPRWLVIINFIFFLIQVYYFFIY